MIFNQRISMSDASPVLLTPDVVGGLAGKRVLVVGDIMLDAYLIGDADRISPERPSRSSGSKRNAICSAVRAMWPAISWRLAA